MIYVYDARRPLQPGIVTGRVYSAVRQETGEVSIYLDTGYEIRMSSEDFAKLLKLEKEVKKE